MSHSHDCSLSLSERNSRLHLRAHLKGELWSCREQYRQVINQARRALRPAPVTRSSGLRASQRQSYCTTAMWKRVRSVGLLHQIQHDERDRGMSAADSSNSDAIGGGERRVRRGRLVRTGRFETPSSSSATNWTRILNWFGLSPQDKVKGISDIHCTDGERQRRKMRIPPLLCRESSGSRVENEKQE